MKNLVLFIILLLSLSGFVFAQEQDKSEENPSKTPLKLLNNPKASYTKEAEKNKIEGEVILRIVFLSNGKIGDIKDVTKENKENLEKYGLTESAMNAAKQIKFIPAKENDKPVDAVKVFVYGFTLF